MKALVTGATGFVGGRLLEELQAPVALVRDVERARGQLGDLSLFRWDARSSPPPLEAFEGVDVIFNLAGEPVHGKRWNTRVKEGIRSSRVDGTRHLVEALASLSDRPRVLVNSSAIGFYGDRGDEILDEDSAPADDFLARVSQEWEGEARRAEELGLRVVRARTGIVLGQGGGALPQILRPFKLGVGGRLASGRQWMSWVHLEDTVGLLLHAAKTEAVTGAMNVVAPEPVQNREFTRVLAKVLHRPALTPTPAFALRLALGEFASFILASTRVQPEVARRTGYDFRFPDLSAALEDACGQA